LVLDKSLEVRSQLRSWPALPIRERNVLWNVHQVLL
jgi:hypothetical protein